MKPKQLVAALQEVRTWDAPRAELEQYPTPPNIASAMLLAAHEQVDLSDALVADLGCGGGVLGIGAALLGAAHVVGVDLDAEALRVAAQNASYFDVPLSLVHADATRLSGRCADGGSQDGDGDGGDSGGGGGGARASFGGGRFDCVLMNPPFGAQRGTQGADVAFLEVALRLCCGGGSVYSLHKSSTRRHVGKIATAWGVRAEVVAELAFEIPRMYDHHTHDALDVAVDFWRFRPGDGPAPHEQMRQMHLGPQPRGGGGSGASQQRDGDGRGGRRGGRGGARGQPRRAPGPKR